MFLYKISNEDFIDIDQIVFLTEIETDEKYLSIFAE